LYKNHLDGNIPKELAKLTILGDLELQNNRFTGEIPQELITVSRSLYVNISFNYLMEPESKLPSTWE